MSKLLPFGDYLLIEPVPKSQVLVSDDEILCNYGTVIAVGSKADKELVGKAVGYEVWGVKTIEIGDKKHYLISQSSDFLLGEIVL